MFWFIFSGEKNEYIDNGKGKRNFSYQKEIVRYGKLKQSFI